MTIVNALSFTLQNGTTADATQVMADFDDIVNDVNANAAHNGVNNDITALQALTTPITPVQGGTVVYTGGTSTGTANAQVVASPVPDGFSLTAGNRLSFVAGFTNTGAATLDANSLGATAILKNSPAGPVALMGGEIVALNTVEAEYDGTQFILLTNAATQLNGTYVSVTNASATCDLGALAPNHAIAIAGTTTITSFGSSASLTYPNYKILFTDAMIITASANIILLGVASITTANGDTAEMSYRGSGIWRMVSYQRQNGQPLQFSAAFLRGYIDGLTLSTAGSSGTMSIAAGIAADSTNVSMMALNSAYTKTTSSWALGTGNGGLDTGAVAINTWYHWYLIQRPDTGVVDVLFSLSATAPTMPANYTLKRRIGSGKTDGSAQWTLFTQTGDEFIWSVTVADANATGANSNSARTNLTLTVPTGVVVNALFRAEMTGVSSSSSITFTSLQESDQTTVNDWFMDLGCVNGGFSAGNYQRLTDTSARIGWRTRSSGATFSVGTYGWIDRRGKS